MRYQAISSAGIGAEPLKAAMVLSSPSPVSTFFATMRPRIGIDSSRSSFFGGILWKTPCWNFSHSRGTEMNSVGCARLMSCTKVSSDSAKNTCVRPSTSDAPSTHERSKLCASGR